jgi:hypothetical protein
VCAFLEIVRPTQKILCAFQRNVPRSWKFVSASQKILSPSHKVLSLFLEIFLPFLHTVRVPVSCSPLPRNYARIRKLWKRSCKLSASPTYFSPVPENFPRPRNFAVVLENLRAFLEIVRGIQKIVGTILEILRSNQKNVLSFVEIMRAFRKNFVTFQELQRAFQKMSSRTWKFSERSRILGTQLVEILCAF